MRGYLVLPVLEPSIVVLGDDKNMPVNNLILLLKCFIHKTRAVKHAINIHALKLYVRFVEKTEQRIARYKDKLTKHSTPYDLPSQKRGGAEFSGWITSLMLPLCVFVFFLFSNTLCKDYVVPSSFVNIQQEMNKS